MWNKEQDNHFLCSSGMINVLQVTKTKNNNKNAEARFWILWHRNKILYGVDHKLKGKLISKLICTFEKRPISS